MALSKCTLILILCFVIADASQIPIRGTIAKEGEFKYQVILYSLEYKHPACGGAILNDWYSLSSAYCVRSYVPHLHKIFVYLGTLRFHEVKQKRAIAEIKIPLQFNVSEKHHDIALIRTTEKIEMSVNVQPIQLPKNAFIFHGTELYSSGFGIRTHPESYMESKNRSRELHYHKTVEIPLDECEYIFNEVKFHIISHTIDYTKRNSGKDFVCAENSEGFEFDNGDQGNPLVANNVLYGIASWSYGPKSYPTVYTRIYSHIKWIEDNAVAPKN